MVAILTGSLLHQEYHKALYLAPFCSYYTYIDDLQNVVSHSTLKLVLFADDVTLYREIKNSADCLLLQQDLDNICSWTIKWQLPINVSKCLAFLISNKRILINFLYKINSVTTSWNSNILEFTFNLTYLGLIMCCFCQGQEITEPSVSWGTTQLHNL